MTKPIDTNEIKDRLHRCDVRELEDYIYRLCDEIDRLRGVQTPTQGKMVNVRIPVAVEKSGYWRAAPRPSTDQLKEYMTDEYAIYWLTATLPVPQEVEVVAEVENE